MATILLYTQKNVAINENSYRMKSGKRVEYLDLDNCTFAKLNGKTGSANYRFQEILGEFAGTNIGQVRPHPQIFHVIFLPKKLTLAVVPLLMYGTF